MGVRSPATVSNRVGVVAALAVAVMAISSSAVLVRWTDASPVTLAFWRTAGGALVLAPAAVRSAERPGRHDRRLIGLAGVALGAHFAAWLASLELTSVAASVTLVSTAPIAVALLLTSMRTIERWRGGDPGPGLAGPVWLAVVGAVIGVAVIASGDGAATGTGRNSTLAGDGLALIGAVTMAVYLVVGDRLRVRLSTAAYAARAYAVAAAALLLAAVAARIPLLGHSASTWAVIGAMIVGPQLAGHTVLNLLLRRLGSVVVSLALLAEPIGASLLAWTLLAEPPPGAVWIGGPIVLAAVASQVRSGAMTPKEPTGSAD